jgi:hypothetical protein
MIFSLYKDNRRLALDSAMLLYLNFYLYVSLIYFTDLSIEGGVAAIFPPSRLATMTFGCLVETLVDFPHQHTLCDLNL